jgi:hypothetical protein
MLHNDQLVAESLLMDRLHSQLFAQLQTNHATESNNSQQDGTVQQQTHIPAPEGIREARILMTSTSFMGDVTFVAVGERLFRIEQGNLPVEEAASVASPEQELTQHMMRVWDAIAQSGSISQDIGRALLPHRDRDDLNSGHNLLTPSQPPRPETPDYHAIAGRVTGAVDSDANAETGQLIPPSHEIYNVEEEPKNQETDAATLQVHAPRPSRYRYNTEEEVHDQDADAAMQVNCPSHDMYSVEEERHNDGFNDPDPILLAASTGRATSNASDLSLQQSDATCGTSDKMQDGSRNNFHDRVQEVVNEVRANGEDQLSILNIIVYVYSKGNQQVNACVPESQRMLVDELPEDDVIEERDRSNAIQDWSIQTLEYELEQSDSGSFSMSDGQVRDGQMGCKGFYYS